MQRRRLSRVAAGLAASAAAVALTFGSAAAEPVTPTETTPVAEPAPAEPSETATTPSPTTTTPTPTTTTPPPTDDHTVAHHDHTVPHGSAPHHAPRPGAVPGPDAHPSSAVAAARTGPVR